MSRNAKFSRVVVFYFFSLAVATSVAAFQEPTQKAAADPNDPAAPHDPGLYVHDGSRMTKLAVSRMQAVRGKASMLVGITGGAGSAVFEIVGDRAAVRTAAARPVFYLYLTAAPYASHPCTEPGKLPSAAEVADCFFIVSVDRKKNRREFEQKGEVQTGPIFSTSVRVSTDLLKNRVDPKKVIGCVVEIVAPGIYKVTPSSDLAPGEYVFYGELSYSISYRGTIGFVDFGVNPGTP